MDFYDRFEWKKFLLNPKNIFLLLLLLILTVAGGFYLKSAQEAEREQTLDELTDQYYILEQFRYQLQQITDGHAENSSFFLGTAPLEQELGTYSQTVNKALVQVNDYYSSVAGSASWEEILKSQSEYYLSLAEVTRYSTQTQFPLSGEQIDSVLTENQYFLDHSIKPDNRLLGYSGLGYLRYVSQFIFSIYILLVCSVVFFDLYRKEFEEKTVKLLYTLPFSRSRIWQKKYRLSLAVTCSLTLLLFLISFITGTIIWQAAGSVSYPVATKIVNGEQLLLWQEMGLNLCLFALFIGVVLLVIRQCSIYTSGLDNTLIRTTAILLLPSLITNQFSKNTAVSFFNPFYYNNLSQTTVEAFRNGQLPTYLASAFVIFLTFYVLFFKLQYRWEGKLNEI